MKHLIRVIAITSSVASILPSAQAQTRSDMPSYDVDQYCRAVARSTGAHSETIFGGCFDMEQQAYDALKPRWAALPASMRRHCDQVARSTGAGSYTILKGCVEMEESSASSNARRQFVR